MDHSPVGSVDSDNELEGGNELQEEESKLALNEEEDDTEFEDTFGLDFSRPGEKRKQAFEMETSHDRCIRKCTMINILILLILLGIFKTVVLFGFGYYTFRDVDKPDCYAPDDSKVPQNKRYDDGDKNVSREYYLIF